MRSALSPLAGTALLLAAGCGAGRSAREAAARTEAPPAPPVQPAPAQPQAASTEPPPAVLAGAELYKTKGCVMCHGEGAKGGVPNRYSQNQFIPALEKVAEGYTEDELKEKIRKGVSSVAAADPDGHVPILVMPSWKDKLTDEELDRIVAYLMSLAPKGGKEDDGF